MKNLIKKYFTEGNARSILVKKHILYSLFVKGGSILIGLVYVPLLIDYLDPERYGVWLTFSSIITWFSFFNLGLGNGLRNNLTKAIANNNFVLARKYVSTTYAILGIIFSAIIILFWIVNPFLSWSNILNTQLVEERELSNLALFVFTLFCLRFVFDLISIVLRADQRPALANAFNPLGNLVVLIIIVLLIEFQAKSSLLLLGVLLSAAPILVLLIASFFLFRKRYKNYRPSFKYVDFSYSRKLLGLGVKFFIIQLAGIIFFSTSNIIITQILGPEQVTIYNISHKYFSIPLMLMTIVMMPIWSAVTDAFHKKDYIWLKSTMSRLNKIGLAFGGLMLLLLLGSGTVYHYWIGDRVAIPLELDIVMAIYFILRVLIAPYASYINGMGILKLSIIMVIVQIALYIGLAIYLTNEIGIIGPVIAMIIINILGYILQKIQVDKNLNQSAYGIWKA